MGDVYRKAQRTLIWIGKEDGDTRAVLELLHAMSTPEFECQEKLDYNLLRNLQDRVEKVLVSESGKRAIGDISSNCIHAGVFLANTYVSDPEQIVNDDYITKFVNILNKPWFSRAWIVQEAALSPHPAVLLGSELFDLRMLYHLLLAVSSLEANTSTHRSIRSSRVLRARGAHTLHHIQTCRLQLQDQAPVQHRLPFLDILRRLAFSVDASDARDQVYAFLALQDPLQIQIKPDYSLDTIDAYAVVSASLAKSTCSLSILGLTRWGPSPFPSWAVDWRLHKSTQGRPFDRDGRENFDACHGYPYRAVDDFKVGSNYLTARGRLVARVAVVSQVAHHSKLLPQAWNIEEVVKSLTLGSRFDEVSLQDYSQSELSKRVLAVLMALDTKTFESDRERDEWLGTMLRVYENYERIVKKDVALADLSHLRVVAKDLARRVGISGNKRVFCSKEGLIGLGPQPINRNDFVWILHGSKVPVILRKWNRDYYIVVGQCYYEKWMYGDVVDWKEDEGDVVNLA